jgi:hypothetical protein
MTIVTWPAAREYQEAIQNPGLSLKDPALRATIPAVDRLGMPIVISGQFAYVFKLNGQNGAKTQAVRCFRGYLGDREKRYNAISNHLKKAAILCLPAFDYNPSGIRVLNQTYPILRMEWIEADALDVYLASVLRDPGILKLLADSWLKVIRSLRTAGVAHGDLQHGNIVIQNGQIRLVDLDGMFVPAMAGWQSAELGHPHYQHPFRTPTVFSAELDNFSALVIYVSLLALAECPSLWSEFHDENLIFTKRDFETPAASPLFPKLKKLSRIRHLVDILEKACREDPLDCPFLLDLVTIKQTLPTWMLNPSSVRVHPKTRENSGGSPVHTIASIKVNPPISPPPISHVATAVPAPAARYHSTRFMGMLRNALNYAFVTVWLAWIWFPISRAIFRAFGASGFASGLISIALFAVACLGRGHKATIAGQNPPSVQWLRVKLFVVLAALVLMLAYSEQKDPVSRSNQSEATVSDSGSTQFKNQVQSPQSTTFNSAPIVEATPEVRRALPPAPSASASPPSSSENLFPLDDAPKASLVATPAPSVNATTWPDGRILNHLEHSIQTTVTNVAPTDTLKLRSGPGTRFASIAQIPAGASISAFDQDQVWDGDTWWCPVIWNGMRGYVSRYYLPK